MPGRSLDPAPVLEYKWDMEGLKGMKKRVLAIIILSLLLISTVGIGVCSAVVSSGVSNSMNSAITVDSSVLRSMIPAPSGLSADVAGTEISLIWVDNSSNETGFEIERKTADGSFSQVDSVGAGITSYDDQGLAAGTKYIYRVRAVNGSSSSAYSNEASETTSPLRIINPDLVPGTLNPGSIISLLPAAPGKLQAVSGSAPEIKVSWADQSTNETGFRLERKDEKTKAFAEIAVLTKDTTEYQDKGLEEGITYIYRARAFNAHGNSIYSNEASAQTATTIYAQPIQGLQKVIKYRIGQLTYTVDGAAYTMDVAPAIINERTYLPIRYLAEPLGASIAWDGAHQKVTFVLDSTTVELVVNNNMATVNGIATPISPDPLVTPLLESGRVLVPMAFVASSLGCDVTWDGLLQEITVTYPKS